MQAYGLTSASLCSTPLPSPSPPGESVKLGTRDSVLLADDSLRCACSIPTYFFSCSRSRSFSLSRACNWTPCESRKDCTSVCEESRSDRSWLRLVSSSVTWRWRWLHTDNNWSCEFCTKLLPTNHYRRTGFYCGNPIIASSSIARNN